MKSKRRRDMYLRALQQIARSRFLTENRFRCWVCRTPLIPGEAVFIDQTGLLVHVSRRLCRPTKMRPTGDN